MTEPGRGVQRAFEVVVGEAEIRGVDRRGEAVVERLAQPERFVDAVPAERQCQFMDLELACVVKTEDLDPGEMRVRAGPGIPRAGTP